MGGSRRLKGICKYGSNNRAFRCSRIDSQVIRLVSSRDSSAVSTWNEGREKCNSPSQHEHPEHHGHSYTAAEIDYQSGWKKRKAEEINTVEVNANELVPRGRTKDQRETNETRGRRKETK